MLAVVVAATACAGYDEVAAQAQWAQTARACGDGGGGQLVGVAIDGKSVRGAAAGGRTRPHLLAAVTHDGSIVLAQRQIPGQGQRDH